MEEGVWTRIHASQYLPHCQWHKLTHLLHQKNISFSLQSYLPYKQHKFIRQPKACIWKCGKDKQKSKWQSLKSCLHLQQHNNNNIMLTHTHTHTHTHLTALFLVLPGWASTRKVNIMLSPYTRSSAITEGLHDASCQLKSCQLPRNSAETTCTTSPEQIKVMKLEGYSGTMSNKHVH